MKITFLLTQDLSSPSGLGRYLPWAKELVKLGHDVRVIALHPDFKGLTVRHALLDGVTIDYAGQMHVKKSGSTKAYFTPLQLIWVVLIGTLKLTAAALTAPGDLLIVGKPHPMNSVAGLIAKLFHPRTRLMLDVDDYEAGSNRFQSKWQKRLTAWFEDTIPRHVELITCNTRFNIKRLASLGIPAGKMTYLPNGIDPDRFQLPEAGEVRALRESLDLLDRKVIVYIGSMSLANHAVNLLLRAFVTVRERITNARLVLVGGGEDLEVLKRLAKDLGIEEAVRFTGRVASSNVAVYYAIGDVSVDPVYDNDAARGRCPLKMFESWACGVPFITADVGDRRALAGNPPAAILVDPGSDFALATGLQHILSDTHLNLQLKAAGNDLAKQYSWKVIVSQAGALFTIPVS